MAKKSKKQPLFTDKIKKKGQKGLNNMFPFLPSWTVGESNTPNANLNLPVTAANAVATGITGLATNTINQNQTITPPDMTGITGKGIASSYNPNASLSPVGPIRTYTPQQRAEMERFAKMSPKEKQREKDKYAGFVVPPSPIKSPSLETRGYTDIKRGEELPQIDLNQQQTLEAGEIASTTPQAVQQAQELSRKVEPEKSRQKARSPFENIKWNEAVQMGLYGVDAFLRKNDAIREQEEYQRRLRNVFTQKPIYDYNYLYGPDSSGGTQYQSMIMAKNGAQIRRGTSPNITDVEVEGGEFIQLPDLSTQHVEGPSHAKGGVHTNLPEGTRVFSDYLKPIGSKKTYAQIAKKYDTEKYREVLENPYANDIDRRTASLLFRKYESILNELFEDQQKQNGNSDGTDQSIEGGMEDVDMGMVSDNPQAVGNFGMYYQTGGEYFLPYEDPDNLFQVYNPYNAYNNFNEYAPIPNPTTMDNMEEYEQGGQYLGGDAYLNGGGSIYQDGGMFPEDSTFYGATPGDTSILTTGTDIMGKSTFDDGGYYSPSGKKYKIPKDAVIKKEGDKGIKAGDFVKKEDGTIVKVTKVQAKMMAKSSKSSTARDFAEGKAFINAWTQESSDNAAKLKRADEIIQAGIKSGQIEEKKPAGWKEGDPIELTIKGNFKPSFRDRLILSEVVNKSGKGFGTDKYTIKTQKGTEGYYSPDKPNGSFVGGMTPQDYEQRATYERALAEGMSEKDAEALATSTDPKQKAENRKRYLQELNLDVSNVPESYLISDDFYKNRYQDITKAIERTFPEGSFRPAEGNDLLSGWEHYDAAAYNMSPSYADIDIEEEIPPGNIYPGISPFKQTPSTPGKFPLYQAIPEAMGYLAGINPYSYYTPDFTHTEIAPPTLNIDPQLQSIDDSLLSAIRQSTGNASVDASRRSGLFNQALQAKQQAFANKQNYDANARFQADQYNAQARDLESYRDVSSAANVYNEYMAAAQDAAEQERLAAISNLVKKRAQFDQDEFEKMLYVSALMPNFYYEGTDLRNPLKLNPYAEQFYSRMASKQPSTETKTESKSKNKAKETKAPEVNIATTPTTRVGQPAFVNPAVAANVLNLPQSPVYSWGQPQMNPNIAYPNFGPTYNMAGYSAANPNMPVTVLPTNVPPTYVPYEIGIPEVNPQDIYMLDEGKMKFGGKTKKNKK